MFTPLEWHEKAACLGAPTEIFFPEINGDKKRCLDEALKNEQPILMRFGMWGGQTPTERGVTASKRAKKTYNL